MIDRPGLLALAQAVRTLGPTDLHGVWSYLSQIQDARLKAGQVPGPDGLLLSAIMGYCVAAQTLARFTDPAR